MHLVNISKLGVKLFLTGLFWLSPFVKLTPFVLHYQSMLRSSGYLLVESRLDLIIDMLFLAVWLFLLEAFDVKSIIFGGERLVLFLKTVAVLYVLTGPVAQAIALTWFRS